MIWTTKTNCALSSRNSTDSASITTTRLSTQRIGSRKVTTPTAPTIATAAAMKKIAIAKLLGFLRLQSRRNVGRQRLEEPFLGIDELLAAGIRQLVLGTQHDRLHRAR